MTLNLTQHQQSRSLGRFLLQTLCGASPTVRYSGTPGAMAPTMVLNTERIYVGVASRAHTTVDFGGES